MNQETWVSKFKRWTDDNAIRNSTVIKHTGMYYNADEMRLEWYAASFLVGSLSLTTIYASKDPKELINKYEYELFEQVIRTKAITKQGVK